MEYRRKLVSKLQFSAVVLHESSDACVTQSAGEIAIDTLLEQLRVFWFSDIYSLNYVYL